LPIGDGSLQYSIQTLWTAVQYNIPVVFVVLSETAIYYALKSFCDFTNVGRKVPGVDIPGIDAVNWGKGTACPRKKSTVPKTWSRRSKRLSHPPALVCSV
jgi:benzoylformate decarboxylase